MKSRPLSIDCRDSSKCNVNNLQIYDQKLIEFNNKALHESTELREDEFGIKQSRNFIDECIRLTVSQKCFKERDAISESITMLLAVS